MFMPMAVAVEEELSRCFYVFELLDTAKITNAIKLTSMAEFYIDVVTSGDALDAESVQPVPTVNLTCAGGASLVDQTTVRRGKAGDHPITG